MIVMLGCMKNWFEVVTNSNVYFTFIQWRGLVGIDQLATLTIALAVY